MPYQKARKLNKEKDKKQRKELFKQAREESMYTDYSLQSFATLTAKRSKWIAKSLDAQSQQKIATRAFKTSERVMLGFAKKVRFKTTSRFKSVEGKTNKQGLRWINNQVVWGGLKIDAILDLNNLVIDHGLKARVKYCRVIRRNLGVVITPQSRYPTKC
ncbi:MAG: hypothetical protein ACFB02_12260 [Mastigocoleus sp.]